MALPVGVKVHEEWDEAQSERRKEWRRQFYEHFKTLSVDKQVHGWDHFWRLKITPWDRHQPHPALVLALRDRHDIFADVFKRVPGKRHPRRKTALIPGCGRGYDVLLFASYGLNAVGLDAAPAAREAALRLLADPINTHHYPLMNTHAGQGEARIITGDFFSTNFLSETHGATVPDGERTFDFIYDYNFLSIIPPVFRSKWAARMSQLLAPSGYLICIEFPLGKDPAADSPPHSLSSALYEQLLARPGEEVTYDDTGRVYTDASLESAENALVKVETWVPASTFDDQLQVGQIKVSLWKHFKAVYP